MLSLEKCRQALGDDIRLSDAEIERVRRDLYTLAEVIVRSAPSSKGSKPPVNARRMMQLVADSHRVELEERAAVMEYDGGCSREAAEHAALSRFGILGKG